MIHSYDRLPQTDCSVRGVRSGRRNSFHHRDNVQFGVRDEAEETASTSETVFSVRYEFRLKKQLSIEYDRL
jgi:hypothetical protein